MSRRGPQNADALLRQVGKVIGDSWLDIRAYSDGEVTVYWRRDYGNAGMSDQRHVTKRSLASALRAVLRWEEKADRDDAKRAEPEP